LAELKVIDELAAAKGQVAPVALRINPEIDAHTHAKITTGMKENKFGINLGQLNAVIDELLQMKHVKLIGIHFHIGSQITDLSSFQNLSIRANEIQEELEARGLFIENVNFGGGLGIDYYHPNHLPVPAFDNYFAVIHKLLKVRSGQQIHFEPGRSIVAQCGTLISQVLYVKEGETKKFAILDAGFTELIRPAMYDAYHRIENSSSNEEPTLYDVVGPICESSDVFGKEVELNKAHRGDYIALRSAGAYGEIMASQYNCRKLPESYFSDTL
jgi:diaminopimelate decarboxylase